MAKYGKKVAKIERKEGHWYYVNKNGEVMESPMAQKVRKNKVKAKTTKSFILK
jgi:hypothetical protein